MVEVNKACWIANIVGPLYKGQPCNEAKVVTTERWPLQRGAFGKESSEGYGEYGPLQRGWLI